MDSLTEKFLRKEIKRLNTHLENINSIMWNTWGLKDKEFGRKEGELIIQELNNWAKDLE